MNVIFERVAFSVTPCQGFENIGRMCSRTSAALHSGLYSFAPSALSQSPSLSFHLAERDHVREKAIGARNAGGQLAKKRVAGVNKIALS
jgi:hypothetical protein